MSHPTSRDRLEEQVLGALCEELEDLCRGGAWLDTTRLAGEYGVPKSVVQRCSLAIGGLVNEPPSAESPPPLAGSLGDYELRGILGQGGMGVVYRAWDPVVGREVALKVALGAEGSPVRAARLRREAELTASLRHPGIVRVYSAGVASGYPFIAYELVEGSRTLKDALRGAELRQSVRMLRDTARALGYAHVHGVVHRDVKPSNVLVDSSGLLRVADFGLGTAQRLSRLTKTGVVAGTLIYLAPEWLEGRRGDTPPLPSGDVWGLGVMLYEALSGQHPLANCEGGELLQALAEADFPPLSQVTPDLPRDLVAICSRALRRDPAERYANGEELARDLDRFLAGEAVLARVASTARIKLLLAAALLLTVLCGAWLAFGISQVGPRTLTTPPAQQSVASRYDRASAQVWAARGQASLLAAELDDAQEEFTRALELDPRVSLAWLGSGRVRLARSKNYELARGDFERALELDAKLAPAWAGRGEAFRGLSQLDEALADLEAALQLDPGLAHAWAVRGECKQATGDFGGARDDLEEALRLDPEQAWAWQQLGIVRVALGDTRGAISALDRSLSLEPGDGYTLGLRGRARLEGKDPEGALRDLNLALKLGQGDCRVYLDRGRVWLLLDNPRQALADFDSALEIYPSWGWGLANRALVRRDLGDLAGAEEDLTRAIERDPYGDPSYLFLRGEIRLAAGRRAGAREDLDRFVESAPQHAWAMRARELSSSQLGQ